MYADDIFLLASLPGEFRKDKKKRVYSKEALRLPRATMVLVAAFPASTGTPRGLLGAGDTPPIAWFYLPTLFPTISNTEFNWVVGRDRVRGRI